MLIMFGRLLSGDAYYFCSHNGQLRFRQAGEDVSGERFYQPVRFDDDQCLLYGHIGFSCK